MLTLGIRCYVFVRDGAGAPARCGYPTRRLHPVQERSGRLSRRTGPARFGCARTHRPGLAGEERFQENLAGRGAHATPGGPAAGYCGRKTAGWIPADRTAHNVDPALGGLPAPAGGRVPSPLPLRGEGATAVVMARGFGPSVGSVQCRWFAPALQIRRTRPYAPARRHGRSCAPWRPRRHG